MSDEGRATRLVSGVRQWLQVEVNARYGKRVKSKQRRDEDTGDFELILDVEDRGTIELWISFELAAAAEDATAIARALDDGRVLPKLVDPFYRPLILTADGVKSLDAVRSG